MLLILTLAESGHYVRRNVEKFSAQHASENLRRTEKLSRFPGVYVCVSVWILVLFVLRYISAYKKKNFTDVHMKLRDRL